MREMGRRGVLREGVLGGLIAGAAFAAAEILAAAMSGLRPGVPWQLSASLLLGGGEVAGPILWGQFVLGALVHFALAALFGLGFGAFAVAIGRRRRNDFGYMLGAGALYGALLWLVNFQLIARLAFPWFRATNGAMQLVVHILAYGLPLAYWVVLRVRDQETPRVHRTRHAWQTPDGDEEKERLRRDLELQRRARRRDARPPQEGPRPGDGFPPRSPDA